MDVSFLFCDCEFIQLIICEQLSATHMYLSSYLLIVSWKLLHRAEAILGFRLQKVAEDEETELPVPRACRSLRKVHFGLSFLF